MEEGGLERCERGGGETRPQSPSRVLGDIDASETEVHLLVGNASYIPYDWVSVCPIESLEEPRNA